MITEFLEYFSHPWHWIEKSSHSAPWRTETEYPIQPANLLNLWRDESRIVGVRFGTNTRYGLIDLDRGSCYHPANNRAALSQIKAALEKIGIYRVLLVQSSESGGLHLYFAFIDSVSSIALAQCLQFAIESSGLIIAAGTLEIFPNAKRYRVDQPSNFAAHRLPLQCGSTLLDSDCNPYSRSMATFLESLTETAKQNDIDELYNAFGDAKKHNFKQGFTDTGEPKGERGKRWKLDCERVIELGWTARSQTNQILGVIAQYGRVFKGLADQALQSFILQTAIACPGYQEFCQHQHEIEQRCRDWAHSAEKAYTPYAGDRAGNAWKERTDRKVNSHNLAQSATALDRIKNAIAQLGDRIFTSIREKLQAIIQIAKCSIQTLYRHKDLWLGCNSQNQPVEANTAIEQKAIEKDTESIEPLPYGLLHPNSTYEGVGHDRDRFPIHDRPPESDFSLSTDTPPRPSNLQKPPKPT